MKNPRVVRKSANANIVSMNKTDSKTLLYALYADRIRAEILAVDIDTYFDGASFTSLRTEIESLEKIRLGEAFHSHVTYDVAFTILSVYSEISEKIYQDKVAEINDAFEQMNRRHAEMNRHHEEADARSAKIVRTSFLLGATGLAISFIAAAVIIKNR
jgi:hypothetical protein